MATRRPAGAKPRDAEGTRAAILEAARGCFSEAGFDSVGLRSIAERAGVDASLVLRYFGSKEGLFEAAVDAEFDAGPEVPNDLGALLTGYVTGLEAQEGFDPMVALLRSASNETAAGIFRALIEKRFERPLVKRMQGPDARTRAALLGSLILGVKLMRDVLGNEALARTPPARLQALLADTFEHLSAQPGARQAKR